jgi:hypothetical protein
MALWGKTDATGSKPKYLNSTDAANAVFVSAEEAVLKTNKDKGILGAGWWLVKEYADADGKPRYKTELLVAMSVANAASGDAADDAKIADVEVTLTIGTQPANQTASAGGATFSVTATASSGTVTYQWQKKESAAGSRWANVSGATSASLALTGLTAGADNGDQYRVVLGSTSGAVKTTSSAATLTVAA